MNCLLPIQKSNVSKTFVIERLDTQQSTFLQVDLDLSASPVDLTHILSHHCPLNTNRVQIYDPTANAFVTIKGSEAKIQSTFLDPTFILVRFGPRPSQPVKLNKQERSKERTIEETIQLVREWRLLHETRTRPENKRKKLSLSEAANLLGVAKKSLDDYYCQLRLAEQLGFDFETHLHDGVGVLRSFVKNQRQNIGKQKHPKILRVIEDLSFLSPSSEIREPQYERKAEERTEEMKEEQRRIQLQRMLQEARAEQEEHGTMRQGTPEYHRGGKQERMIQTLASEYYRGFQYLLDDPIDPFLNLSRSFNVRLSNEDDESNSILFF